VENKGGDSSSEEERQRKKRKRRKNAGGLPMESRSWKRPGRVNGKKRGRKE
jgi:hypothetical protein